MITKEKIGRLSNARREALRQAYYEADAAMNRLVRELQDADSELDVQVYYSELLQMHIAVENAISATQSLGQVL